MSVLRSSVRAASVLAAIAFGALASGCETLDGGPGTVGPEEQGCTASAGERLLATADGAGLPAIAVDESFLYYTAGSGIYKVALAGGAPKMLAPLKNHFSVINVLLLEGSNVYYRDDAELDHEGIYAVDKSGSKPAVQLASLDNVAGMVIDHGVLYASDSGVFYAGDSKYPAAGRILAIDLSSSKVTELATGQRQPGEPAADDSYVYWYNSGTNDTDLPKEASLMRVAKSGGPPEVLLKQDVTVPGHRGIGAIFPIDGDLIFGSLWINAQFIPQESGTYRFPKDGRGGTTKLTSYGTIFRGSAMVTRDHLVAADGPLYDISFTAADADGSAKALTCGRSFSVTADAHNLYYTEDQGIFALAR